MARLLAPISGSRQQNSRALTWALPHLVLHRGPYPFKFVVLLHSSRTTPRRLPSALSALPLILLNRKLSNLTTIKFSISGIPHAALCAP